MRGVLAGRGIESIRRGISETVDRSRARLCAYFGGCSKMVEVPRWRMCPAGVCAPLAYVPRWQPAAAGDEGDFGRLAQWGRCSPAMTVR